MTATRRLFYFSELLRLVPDALLSRRTARQRYNPSFSRLPVFSRPYGNSHRSEMVGNMTTSEQTPSTSLDEYEDFFRYTSGRWIWDEEQQLRDRYRVFDVPALQHIAAESVGSSDCVSMMKLAEGGFNKVFRLVMNDGKIVIARIPNPNAGPSFYTTASEVATMEFVRALDV